MGFFSTICPGCGEKIKKSARFCKNCGADSQTGWRLCEAWHVNKADAKFCSRCGRPLMSASAGGSVAHVWNRAPEDFAQRFELPDFRGAFTGGFYVETGTRALLLVDGRYVQSLPPGLYSPQSPSRDKIAWDNFPRHATVVAVDAGDAEVQATISDLFAKDDVKVRAALRLVLRIADEAAFFVNLMKDREAFTIHDLTAMLYDELRNALAESVSKRDAEALAGDLAVKKEFETVVEHHLSRTLGRVGLTLVQIRSVEFSHAEDKLREEKGNLSTYKKRVALWDEIRRAAKSDKMNKVTTEEELAKFLHEIDKDKLLRTEEMEELQRGFGERKEDNALARGFLVEKLTLEHNLEMRRVRLVEEGKMNLDGIDNEIEAERRKKAAALDNWEAGVRRKIKVAEDALGLKEKKMQLKHKDKMLEIDRARELSKVSAEVLMTMTDTDKAKMIADLTRTKMMKDLDSDKILAMSAGVNPDSKLAEAFAEKFKALQDGKLVDMQKEMYEKFFKQLSETHKEAMDMVRDVAKSAATPKILYPRGGA